MEFKDLLLVALALALDAFGVALGIGLNPIVKKKNKITFILSFGFFQFLFAFIGGYGGSLFSKYILCLPKVVGGTIVSLVGVFMLKESMENKKEDKLILRNKTNIILGASVSVDAMVVGFTVLNGFNSIFILTRDTLFMGIVALIMTTIAFCISKSLKKFDGFEKYADLIGGIILILFGIKMMFL
ncbi:manganese efflux pump [Hathewaya massiliensis]|uniref:manganese efflux pump n=1 Tax=Hathewaya massiliensis TaxID=1964382 RepID=UPI00115951B3|nr:manganese efflux pump [Hathewaya massiliensis]